tara:strand:+ start:762 stop:1088 length:327 start_codon:yes stop_codon:yes gene_type:complete
MKFYIVMSHHVDNADGHHRESFTNKRDAVRAAKRLYKDCEEYEWYSVPTAYRVTTDGSKREVMELVAGSRYHGKWVEVWSADDAAFLDAIRDEVEDEVEELIIAEGMG